MQEVRGWREEMTINMKGGMADAHELDAAVLGESLLGLVKLAERTNAFFNKEVQVSVKVKGGFYEGSFDYTIVMDFFGAFVPAIPQVVETIKQIIEFRQFLKGEDPVRMVPEGANSSVVENNSGDTFVFQNSTIILNNNHAITKSLQKVFKPFENGVAAMEIGSGDAGAVTVESESKDLFLAPKLDQVEVEDLNKTLEVLTAQMDGKPVGWRFYDVDDDVVFSAGIADSNFLNAVNSGVYGFLRGSYMSAIVRTEKKKIDGRRRTERTILNISPVQQ